MCFPLGKAQKNNGGNDTRGGELLSVEQAVTGVWLLLVPNTNLCPFW